MVRSASDLTNCFGPKIEQQPGERIYQQLPAWHLHS